MTNRRKALRAPKRLKVEYGIEKLDQKALTNDISVGGLFIVTRPIIDVGTRLHLHVYAPEGDFYAEGVVAHRKRVQPSLQTVDPQGLGVRFVAPSDIVSELVPSPIRKVETLGIRCATVDDLRALVRDQLRGGALMIPVGNPPPTVNSSVEFDIVLDFVRGGEAVRGQGRVVQLFDAGAGDGATKSAVVEVQDADQLRDGLANTLRNAKA